MFLFEMTSVDRITVSLGTCQDSLPWRLGAFCDAFTIPAYAAGRGDSAGVGVLEVFELLEGLVELAAELAEAEERADAGEELDAVDGLGEEVVGPSL